MHTGVNSGLSWLSTCELVSQDSFQNQVQTGSLLLNQTCGLLFMMVCSSMDTAGAEYFILKSLKGP